MNRRRHFVSRLLFPKASTVVDRALGDELSPLLSDELIDKITVYLDGWREKDSADR